VHVYFVHYQRRNCGARGGPACRASARPRRTGASPTGCRMSRGSG
jgi:hypothetical protein